MKKTLILTILIVIILINFSVADDYKNIELYINQNPIYFNNNPIVLNGVVLVPLTEFLELFNVELIYDETIISYFSNNFLKIDQINSILSINGKKFPYNDIQIINNNLYIDLNDISLYLDLEIKKENDYINIIPNNIIQYKNYDNIPFHSIFLDENISLVLPLDWLKINNKKYGYTSKSGEIFLEYEKKSYDSDIDENLIINSYIKQLELDYDNEIDISSINQTFINYLIAYEIKVQYDINSASTIYFIIDNNNIHILNYSYPTNIAENYINKVIYNSVNSFYINGSSFDTKNEHYVETIYAKNNKMNIISEIYSNMEVKNSFILEGYFNNNENIKKLKAFVKKDSKIISFDIDVINNAFKKKIFTPFGLGKHDIEICIDESYEKIVLDDYKPELIKSDNILLKFSVVNTDNKNITYLIPTSNIQSDDKYIKSLAKLLTRKSETNYLKAYDIYDYIINYITVLDKNDENYTASDVNINFKGTKLEIMNFFVSLLRSIDIPARIVEGNKDYIFHQWIEIKISDRWIIIEPFDTNLFYLDEEYILYKGFNKIKSLNYNFFDNIYDYN